MEWRRRGVFVGIASVARATIRLSERAQGRFELQPFCRGNARLDGNTGVEISRVRQSS